jgi:hypothetical protein
LAEKEDPKALDILGVLFTREQPKKTWKKTKINKIPGKKHKRGHPVSTVNSDISLVAKRFITETSPSPVRKTDGPMKIHYYH